MVQKFYNQKYETMRLEDLKKLQLRRIKHIIKYVYKNNKFYKKLLQSAKIHPEDISTLKNFQKIPFLTKEDLREYYPCKLQCVALKDIVELHASSGTTGKPVVNTYTLNDLDIWTEVMARGLYAGGLRTNDILQNTYAYGLFTGAHGFERGARAIGALVIPAGSGNTQRQIQLMQDFKTTALACTPSYALYIAEVAKNLGIDVSELNVRLGFFGAEVWSEQIRKKIETTWDMTAREAYGLTEIIGPGVSFECTERTGLHINIDHFYTEIIESETGEVIGENEKGELVFTTLTKEALPMIRFRTRDLATYSEDKCYCGRTLPRHSRIIGRSDDMIKVKGVIVFPSQIEEALMSVKDASENYQIIKSQKGYLNELKVKVEPKGKKVNTAILKNQLENKLYTILNLNIPVEVVDIGTLPRSEGKAKRVV